MMKIVKFNKTEKKAKSKYAKKTAGADTVNSEHPLVSDLRLAFFSKGNIFLESGEASFKMKGSEGLSLAEVDCFGQLVCNDFDRLVNDTKQFSYNGSPVRFIVNFFDENSLLIGQLISDSIFTNVGFGKGEGIWEA